MYVKPTDVLSPRGHVEVLDVLYDAGEWDVSVARINYRDELNQPFSEWTRTFTDPRLCAAIVDRLTFHGTIIETGTDSYRLAHTRQADSAAQR